MLKMVPKYYMVVNFIIFYILLFDLNAYSMQRLREVFRLEMSEMSIRRFSIYERSLSSSMNLNSKEKKISKNNMIKKNIYTDYDSVNVRVLKKREFSEHLENIAKSRLRYFKEFPYLYYGTLDCEMSYLDYYYSTPKARIIIDETDKGEVVGFSTCIPLQLHQSLNLLEKLDTKDYYCLNETIIFLSHRNKGLATRNVRLFESLALELGFKKCCFFSVVRDKDDPRMPKEYKDIEKIFSHFGYNRSDIMVKECWTTLQADGSFKVNDTNSMMLWVKNLSLS